MNTRHVNLILFAGITLAVAVLFSFMIIIFAPRGIMAIAERRFTSVPEPTTVGKAPLNQISHVNRFPTPDDKIIVRPNADTFYSSGWYKLDEPLVMSIPETDGRYYSVQFNDMWTNAFDYVGKRVNGADPITCFITGPGWSGSVPADMKHISCPTSKIWIIVRTMVFDEDDRTWVADFQQGFDIYRER